MQFEDLYPGVTCCETSDKAPQRDTDNFEEGNDDGMQAMYAVAVENLIYQCHLVTECRAYL